MKTKFKLIIAGICCFLLTGCENLAIMFTPKKQPKPSHSKLASLAEDRFWDTLHQGRYDDIQEADRLLMAAYLQNPNDPKLAAHLGFLHIWKITERNRAATLPPTIVNNIILSTKYFSDAVELAPLDPRFLGFYGDSLLAEGDIFHDQRQQTHGYFTVKRSIKAWPEFNKFTGGYVMSTRPADSDHFKEGLAWQWDTMDLCAMQHVSRSNPDFSPFMKYETQTGPKRACWNSWIAPYNFEGFFLNMGDMLVKSGDWRTGIQIYNNAKLASNYSSWPYKGLLEKRIANAKENVANFQKSTVKDPNKAILFNSGYGCVACHQKS